MTNKEVKDYMTCQENRSRQYNLLFYGISKTDKENTTEVVLECLKHSLKIPVEVVDDITIQNAHRIPRNPSNTYMYVKTQCTRGSYCEIRKNGRPQPYSPACEISSAP
jgi:hypothetical protein